MFGYGLYPKVAVNASGLAVEVEQLDGSIGKISYRIGQVGGSSVTWGDRYEVPIDPFTNLPAYRPSVAITKGGQVIIVGAILPAGEQAKFSCGTESDKWIQMAAPISESCGSHSPTLGMPALILPSQLMTMA